MTDNKKKENSETDDLDDLLENFLIEEDKEEDIYKNENSINKKNIKFKNKSIKKKIYNNNEEQNLNNLVTLFYLFVIFNIGFNNLLLFSSFYYVYNYTNRKTLINFTTVAYYYIFGLIPTICMIIVFCIYSLSLNWDFITTFYDFTDFGINKNLKNLKDNFYKSIDNINNLSTITIINKKYNLVKNKLYSILKIKNIDMLLYYLNKIIGFIFKNIKYILMFLKNEIELIFYNFFKRWEKKLFNKKINDIKIPNLNNINVNPAMRKELGNLIHMMGEAKDMMRLVNEKNE